MTLGGVLSICTIVAQAITLFQDGSMPACVDLLVQQKTIYDQSLLPSDEMLCTFFSDDRVRNSYLIFALGYELDKTADGKEMMDRHIHKNVVRIVRSNYTTIKIQSSRGVPSYLVANTAVGTNSYVGALFGSSEFNTQSYYFGGDKFTLKPTPSKVEFQLKLNFGVESYLCVDTQVTPKSYRGALFGSLGFLRDSSYNGGQYLRLHPVAGGQKFMIQASFGEDSYLYATYLVSKGSSVDAYFGTAYYLRTEDHDSGKVFNLVFN